MHLAGLRVHVYPVVAHVRRVVHALKLELATLAGTSEGTTAPDRRSDPR